MAVNIDRVYQRVLALANKEQRGYLTPQEFNLFANQAQAAIYETYFYEKDKALVDTVAQGNNTESDMLHIINEKLKPFYTDTLTAASGITLASTVYRLDKVYAETSNSGIQECQEVTLSELRSMINTGSDLTPNLLQPFVDRPVYFRKSETIVNVHASTSETVQTSGVTYSSYVKPTLAIWGYVVTNLKALHDPTTSTNFQLHPSEESNLVIKVLELAGITLNKPGLVQVANQEEAEILQMKNS